MLLVNVDTNRLQVVLEVNTGDALACDIENARLVGVG